MKMTPARRRTLELLSDGESRPVWKIIAQSKSYASGYRVIEALYAAGLITAKPSHSDPWYYITDAGRAALGEERRA